jgi:hypothetical protein
MTDQKPKPVGPRPLESRSRPVRWLIEAIEAIQRRYYRYLNWSERRLGVKLDAAPVGTRHSLLVDDSLLKKLPIYGAHGWVGTGVRTVHTSNVNPTYTTDEYLKVRQPTKEEIEAWHGHREEWRHP